MRRSQLSLAIAAIVATVVTLVAADASAATAVAAVAPSVRLFGSTRRIDVSQNALRFGAVDLGLWVAAVGGDFQIDLRRPDYGAWTAVQLDAATGAPLRPIPSVLVDPVRGLRQFLRITFVDAHGRVAARRDVPFCPDGQASRVDDSGPLNPSYLSFCQSFTGFPFVRGEVWGINRGWAVSPILGPGLPIYFPSGPPPLGPIATGAPPPQRQGWIALAPGPYTATASITGRYRTLLGIPAAQATATVRVRVLYSPPPRRRPPPRVTRPGGKPEDARDAAAPRLSANVTTPDPATMPNLVAAPAWGIAVREQGRARRGFVGIPGAPPPPIPQGGVGGKNRRAIRDVLTFSATIWNAGPAPFSIEGFRRRRSDLMDAYEYFFDAGGNVVGRAPAGTLGYDSRPGHHHWHLRQLASYALVGGSRTIMSQKQSFCIAPTDPVDLTMPGAQGAQIPLGFGGTVCDLYQPSAIWIRELLPAGWGDTYMQTVAGQAFDITHVPNGNYRIVVRVNPLGLLHETSTADDVAVRQIRLSGRRGARRVQVAAWHGING